MVFQHVNGKAIVNGKELKPADRDEGLERVGKHIRLTKEQIQQRYTPGHRQAALDAVEPTEPLPNFDQECAENTKERVLPDPFGPIEAIASQPVYERQRIVHDQGAFVDSWLLEIAVVAKDRAWLKSQIADPRWADHPGRPDALAKIEAMNAQISEIADSIAWAEAFADRQWQTLTPEERKPVAYMWLTSHEDARLVTRAWKDQAQFCCSWPKGFRVEGVWFKNLPDRLYMDLMPLWRPDATWLGEPIFLSDDDMEIDIRGLID